MMVDTIILDDRLPLAALAPIAEGAARLALSEAAWVRIRAAHGRMSAAIAEGRLIYGITTGFGPLANRLSPPERAAELQRGLIYHLATGVGRPLPYAQARAIIIARIAALAQGWSGASPALIEQLLSLINAGLAPLIPEKGTVGASGDLTPMAHVALALMGEGGFIDAAGQPAAFGPPFAFADRDGLALVNGASAMTGLAALNAIAARRLIEWGCATTIGAAELLEGRLEAWDETFSRARPHRGQAEAASMLRSGAAGSRRLHSEPAAASRIAEAALAPRPLQDAYSVRCAPQILGAALDALTWHDHIVETELNSATDNPLITPGEPPALHGGNFMGCHVALASDSLRNAVILAAILAERQIARLTNERLNHGLPAFLHRGEAGFDSGLMGAQVTATALLAELRTLGAPASIQSISTNADNQDVVSMGTIAARLTTAALADAFRIQAIAALAIAQGADIIGGEDWAPATRELRRFVRAHSPPLLKDRPLAGEIEALAAAMAAFNPQILSVHRE